MAIVRARRPNLAELCNYRPFLEHFDVTFFFSGSRLHEYRSQLDSFGLDAVKAVRYATVSDLIPSEFGRRVLEYKVGVGSYMLSHLSKVLSHDYINVVDPVFSFTHQIAGSIRPDQKLIVVRWENIYERYDRIWMAASRAHRVFRRANVVICVSKVALSTLCLPEGFSGKTVHIYPGIDVRRSSSKRLGITAPDLGSVEQKARSAILFVGRLQWTKGLQVLLVALHILDHRMSLDADLWVIGGGDTDLFKALVGRLGLADRVRFFGAMSNPGVREKMADADIFCFPSLLSPNWMEQYGFALVEAMAHGLPVVAFDSGAIREVCGDDAIYASTGNANSLADGIARLLQNRADSLARGERLRQRALREFDADRQGSKMLDAIL